MGRRRIVACAVALVWVPGAAACGGAPGDSACRPGPLKVDRSTAAPGDAVTLSADAVPCGRTSSLAATYQIVLLTQNRNAPAALGRAEADQGGAFSVRLVVPDVLPGQAAITVQGSALDRSCQDTDGKCASYAAPLMITAGSG